MRLKVMEIQHEILHLIKDSISNQNLMSQRLNDFFYYCMHERITVIHNLVQTIKFYYFGERNC